MPKTKEDVFLETTESLKKNKLAGKKAKRDHVILQNDFRADIKKGDSLDDIPERFYETLKTEKVI